MPKISGMNKASNKKSGFTLIELMIVLVVVAVLMTIALPAYQDYIRKARRSDGMDALMTVQQLQERYRANNPEYASSLTDTGTGLGMGSALSLEGYYALDLTGPTGSGSPTSTGYQITAQGQGDQANDEVDGTTCTLVITVDADNPRGEKTPEVCW